MTSTLLRQLWQVIEETQTSALLDQADAVLIDTLIKQLAVQRSLSQQDQESARVYLQSHLLLVRDSADARRQPCYSAAA